MDFTVTTLLATTSGVGKNFYLHPESGGNPSKTTKNQQIGSLKSFEAKIGAEDACPLTLILARGVGHGLISPGPLPRARWEVLPYPAQIVPSIRGRLYALVPQLPSAKSGRVASAPAAP